MFPGQWYSKKAKRREWITEGLRVLADSVGRIPDLHNLQYSIRIRETWKLGEEELIEGGFGDLRKLFVDKGVDFTAYVDEYRWL